MSSFRNSSIKIEATWRYANFRDSGNVHAVQCTTLKMRVTRSFKRCFSRLVNFRGLRHPHHEV